MGSSFKLQKLNISQTAIAQLIGEVADKVSEDTVEDLKRTSPKDDTTLEKAKYIYAQTKQRAWVMDSKESRLYWNVRNKRYESGRVRVTLENDNPAVISLALGFIFEEANITSSPVERTQDGLYSEQDPEGMFALESLERAFKENNMMNVEKHKK